MKAKDLLKKSQDELEEDVKDPEEEKGEDERVNDAYESLSKKLETIRGEKKVEEEDEEEDDKESKESDESEDEEEVSKVSDVPKVSKVEEDEEEDKDEPKKTFVKEEIGEGEDPLDQDQDLTEAEVKKLNEVEEEEEQATGDLSAEEEEKKEVPMSNLKTEDNKVEPQEHTLDDLAEEDERENAQRPQSMRTNLSDEDDNSAVNIPPLGTRSNNLSSNMNSDQFSPRRQSGAGVDASFPGNTHGPFSNRYQSSERRRGTSKFHLILLLLIGVAVIGGTVYLLQNQFQSVINQTPSPSPSTIVLTSSPSPLPSPSPVVPDIDRAKYKVRVLNGTSKSGFAASTSAKLKDLGYQTEKAANATNSAFTKTFVRVKASATGLLEQLIRDLVPDFEATSASNLKETDTIDGEVILGAN